MTDIDMRGHTYDTDMMAAPVQLLLTYRRLDQAMGTPEVGRLLDRVRAIRISLELRAQDLHAVVLFRPDGRRVCCCGLLVPELVEAEVWPGHLDMVTWRKAGGWVAITGNDRYVAGCQCGWRHDSLVEGPAREAVAAHRSTHRA